MVRAYAEGQTNTPAVTRFGALRHRSPLHNEPVLLVSSHDGSVPLIVQASAAPVVVGVGRGGVDTPCPSCRRVVLLENMPPDAVYDLAFRCFGCGALSRVPDFPAGRGIGAAVTVVPPGRHVAKGGIAATGDQVVIGEPGMKRRLRETGARDPRRPQERIEMGPPGIEKLLREAHEALPIIDGLMPKYERRPANRHRLPELVARLRANLSALASGSDRVDVISFIELTRAVQAFARWQADPNHARLLAESKNPDAFAHNILLLELASLFADSSPAPGLGPEFIPAGSGRTPDLRLRPSARQVIEVELKAPRALQRRPGTVVRPKEAAELISNAIRESRTQFSPGVPSMLAIGGAFWTDDFDRHAAATAEALYRHVRQQLIGVVLTSTTIVFGRTRGNGPFEDRWDEVDWYADTQFRWVENPAYVGDLRLSFAPDLSSFEMKFFAGYPPAHRWH